VVSGEGTMNVRRREGGAFVWVAKGEKSKLDGTGQESRKRKIFEGMAEMKVGNGVV